jgi:hypothetical protein
VCVFFVSLFSSFQPFQHAFTGALQSFYRTDVLFARFLKSLVHRATRLRCKVIRKKRSKNLVIKLTYISVILFN